MLTDDPGTPGDGHLEVNLAATWESDAHRQLWELPVADINYGVGERIQLNLSMSLNLDQDAVSGAGSTSAAVKWRFLDREGLAASIYPRVEWNTSSASARLGLVDEGTRFFLPLELARQFGVFDVNVELGRRLSTVEAAEWVYGALIGVPAAPATDLMAELHGECAGRLDRGRLTANIGLKQQLQPWASLIASLGHDIQSAADARPAFIAYLGLQGQF